MVIAISIKKKRKPQRLKPTKMKYNLSKDIDLETFKLRAKLLIESESRVELKKIRQSRSISQNKYFHVVISLYASNFGLTLYEAKIDLKRMCDFMTYEKNGKKYLVQTSKQNSKELSLFIEWIRNLAGKNGCYIPTSEEYLINKYSIDKEIDSCRAYL